MVSLVRHFFAILREVSREKRDCREVCLKWNVLFNMAMEAFKVYIDQLSRYQSNTKSSRVIHLVSLKKVLREINLFFETL